MWGCLWLRSKIMYTNTTVSTTDIQILNTVSLMWVATIEPAMLPTTAGIDSFMPLRTSSMRLRRKATDEVRFCNTTAMRLVPFATPTGKPNTMNNVMEMIDPPPARVLIMPTTTPERTSTAIMVIPLISHSYLSAARHPSPPDS